MKMKLINCFAKVLIAAGLKLSDSWGEVGHKSIAGIAEIFLTQNTNRSVNEILNNYHISENKTIKSLVDIAIYTD